MILFAAAVRPFLRDRDAFLLAIFFGGMGFISINRNKARYKVEQASANGERRMSSDLTYRLFPCESRFST
jgi:hypothetical protein